MFAAPELLLDHGQRPGQQRCAASGMRSTFQNSGAALSSGVFFSVMIAGLASRLPVTLAIGLRQHGVAPASRTRSPRLPPVSSLFAAVLGVSRSATCWHARGGLRRPARPRARQALSRAVSCFPPASCSGPFQLTAWSSCSPWPPSCPSSPPWLGPARRPPRSRPSRSRGAFRSLTRSAAAHGSHPAVTFQDGARACAVLAGDVIRGPQCGAAARRPGLSRLPGSGCGLMS